MDVIHGRGAQPGRREVETMRKAWRTREAPNLAMLDKARGTKLELPAASALLRFGFAAIAL